MTHNNTLRRLGNPALKEHNPFRVEDKPRSMIGAVVAKASCGTGSPLFWYLDGNFLGKTVDIHTMALSCKTGKHMLSVFDNEDGAQRTSFNVVRK